SRTGAPAPAAKSVGRENAAITAEAPDRFGPSLSATSEMGQLEAFAPPEASGRCQIRKRSLAAASRLLSQALSDDEAPIIFPIEAKAAADALNRVQIFNMIEYCRHFLRT